jgi:hypothetical protein
MDDTELMAWLVCNSLVDEAEEWMFTVAENSVTGHLGCFGKASGGVWQTIDDKMLRALLAARVCLECLRTARLNNDTWGTAQRDCDAFCPACELAQQICLAHVGKRSHWHYTKVICSRCQQGNTTCAHLWCETAAMDQGGGQHALVNQGTRRNAPMNRGMDSERPGKLVDRSCQPIADGPHVTS